MHGVGSLAGFRSCVKMTNVVSLRSSEATHRNRNHNRTSNEATAQRRA